jgi:Domain of unknown function (DUF4157)
MAAAVRAAPMPAKSAAPVAVPAPARAAPTTLAAPRLTLGGGGPIPTPTRQRLESSLGANLKGIQVHSGTGAAAFANKLQARAFAFGPQIVLGAGQRADDLPLMAHEVAHVLQQQDNPTPQRWANSGSDASLRGGQSPGLAGLPALTLGRSAGERPPTPPTLPTPHHSTAAIQRWTPYSSDRYESEANRAAAAVVRGEQFTVAERTGGPRVQPLLGIDIDIVGRALDYIAPKANAIPGFRMFTVVLGVNPINMSPVDRSPANIIRAVIEFMPGGTLITQALDNHGILDKVGGWVAEQIKTLGLIGGSIKEALTAFVKSLGVTDIGNLGGVWDRAKRIFTEPIDRIKTFVVGLVTGIITFIKDAILMPLAKLAEGTRGWDLLTAVLGKNPITGEKVTPSAETLIPGFLKLIGQEEVWNNMKKSNALGRAWAWFQGAMKALMGFVNQIPTLAIATFKSLELADIILVPRALAKVATVFGTFIGDFIGWAGNAVWNLLEIIFDVVSPGAFDYVKRTGAALKSILKNPLPFVGNLVKAAKLGFQKFAGNFGTHFKAGLLNWLTGSLPGLYIPTAFSLIEIGKFVLSVLGISWPQIRGKIVKVLGPSGETIMTWAETGVDVVVALVKGGPAAAWEVIKEKLTDLKDTVIGGITDMVVDFVVKTAIPKLIAMFIPGVGFIPAIVSIYQTIQTFVQQLAKIAQVIKGFIDSIVAIAAGNIGAAVGRVESILAGLLSLAISFLAGAFGLGKVSDKVRGIINKIRAKIDKAIDAALAWIVAKAKALFAKAPVKGDTQESKGVKAAVGKELRGKRVGSKQEEHALIESTYAKYASRGLKGIRFDRQGKGLTVLVSASLAEEVARLDLTQADDRRELLRIMHSMYYMSKSTTIYTYYNGARIDRVENYPGHAEAKFVSESLGKLIPVIELDIASGRLKPDGSVTVRLDITRSPCKGCAETHIPEAVARLKAVPALKNLRILLSINAAAVTTGRPGEVGLELLLKPENAGKVEIKASDLWKAILDQVRAYPQFFVEVVTVRHFTAAEIGEFQRQATILERAIDGTVKKHNEAPSDEKKGSI